jgi:DNA ligase (NAD+)
MYNKKTDLELILGKANYSNILSSLKANDKIPITVFLKAIGIPKVGSMVNRIIETFNINSIDKLSEFTPGQINSIHGFGIGKTKSFIKTIQDKKGEIEKLQKFITITFPDFHGNLYGVNFVFTGKFENPSRKELENIISKLDGNIQNSVSNSTHFLVWDGNINSSKFQKAKKLKTLIITKDQIVPMMDEKDK